MYIRIAVKSRLENVICFGRFNAISEKYILKFFSKILKNFFQNLEICFSKFFSFFKIVWNAHKKNFANFFFPCWKILKKLVLLILESYYIQYFLLLYIWNLHGIFFHMQCNMTPCGSYFKFDLLGSYYKIWPQKIFVKKF